MTRDRLRTWLTAVAVAALGGALVAVPLTLLLRGWLGAGRDGSWTAVIAIAYAVWAITSAVASAVWLRRAASR